MYDKKIKFLWIMFGVIALSSCHETKAMVEDTYIIIWQNDNGNILEIDRNVKKGSLPTYNGSTPTKNSDATYSYTFAGWDPQISAVYENTSYTATYTKQFIGINDNLPGATPHLSENGQTIQYGYYPQTHIQDESLISALNLLNETTTNGWYFYEGNYYCKETAQLFNHENYSFDDKTIIEENKAYWFLCEPITWNVLKQEGNLYFLLSSMLLDTHEYYTDYANRNINNQNIYANNYEYSTLRTWLNNDFYNQAFVFNNSYIQPTMIDNSYITFDATEDNSLYASNPTQDKVSLPSYQDYLNENYGFESDVSNVSITRQAKTTDYARAKNAWCNTTTAALQYNGSYWTRSPSNEFYYAAWNVNSGGYLSTYAVDGNSHCVRPCITIKI